MTVNLDNIGDQLKEEFGERGVDYLLPQIDIIRKARDLPSYLEDFRLKTRRFFEAYQMIQKWLAPVIVPIQDELTESERQLKELQYQIKYHLQQEKIFFWKDVIKSQNPTITSLYTEIVTLRQYILHQRRKFLNAAHRDSIPELLSLILWPYSEYDDLQSALDEVKRIYFGPNYFYKKQNVFTDSLILDALCEDVLEQRKKGQESIKQIKNLVENSLTFRTLQEQLEWSKYQRNPNDGYFTEMQVKSIVKAFLPKMSTSELFAGINPFYDSSRDKYPIAKFLEWFTGAMRRKSTKYAEKMSSSVKKKEFLIGLSFMDKHRRQEILGNINLSLEQTFARILAPFHELKQDNAFMQSAQFEIQNVIELPSQAWIYDYTGVETEILRSTLLLISDRQPKFDVLEACQRLANVVLSGRVDRNDYRQGNYIVTNKLPRRIWDYIGDSVLKILEEALVHEESAAVNLIKNIFKDEDRSKLVTSKKFIPIFLVKTNFQYKRKTGYQPQTISIWAREGFEFQYRFTQLSGYPWYFDINELLESLVIEALDIPSHKVSQLLGNVKLRQTVYSVDDETYIIYYGAEEETISALAFKEIDVTEEGIDPVEVIFRPHKFLGLGPTRNDLKLILDEARATDPKDLMTIISNL
ncbi:MAG: hypothetical protein ACTSW1_15670 [Candidatus Hodarchaeales archaeon]